MQNETLENLRLVLTSPRERAKGTIVSYLSVSQIFLNWLGDKKEPTDKDFRRFFLWRREQGVRKSTMRRDFIILKKLALANHWAWNFTKEDTPVADEESSPPAHTLDEIETIIRARNQYSKAEQFYLALATVWGLRREDMRRVRKRDWDNDTILIRRAKKSQQRRHLIPNEIKPILADYHPKIEDPSTLSHMYHRIVNKAGVKVDRGYGFHAIRYGLAECLDTNLAKNGKKVSLRAHFMGWSLARIGTTFYGAPMAGIYSRPEIVAGDPYAVDRLVLPVHPFLPFYREDKKHG